MARPAVRLMIALATVALVALPAADLAARERRADTVGEVAASTLPREAREVLGAIRNGGPFRYDRDGVVFGNRERVLPSQPRGYYHEYTVPTPGARNRGARRIVCGGAQAHPDACYYSDDHYQSFGRIRE